MCVCVFVRVRAQYVYTRGRADKVYKVWDLKNYEHIYSIHDNNIYEIKISPVPRPAHVPSSLCCSRSEQMHARRNKHALGTDRSAPRVVVRLRAFTHQRHGCRRASCF
jgi:hypothetical protein